MPEYRLYCLNEQGRFTKSHEINASDDAHALDRALARIEGDIVLVGHAYAGAVIGASDPEAARPAEDGSSPLEVVTPERGEVQSIMRTLNR